MSFTSRINVRRARNALLSLAVAGSGVAAFAATESAAHAAPSGYVTVVSCASVAGKATFTPGLLKTTARPTTGHLDASIAGCTGELAGGMSGVGTLVATLSGTPSLASENFSGTFTISWPGGGLNPSSGNISVYDSNGTEQVYLSTTSGALVGQPTSVAFVVASQKGTGAAGHAVKSQQLINSTPLTVSENDG